MQQSDYVMLPFVWSFNKKYGYVHVNAEIEAHRPLVRLHGIPEYEDLIAAIMIQGIGGQGSDLMQFGVRLLHLLSAHSGRHYRLGILRRWGMRDLTDCLRLVVADRLIDLDRIFLVLQGFIYSSAYIGWPLGYFGGHSRLNALSFPT